MSKRSGASSEPSSAKRRRLDDNIASQSQSPSRGKSVTQDEKDELVSWLDQADQTGSVIFNTTKPAPRKGAKKGTLSVTEQQLVLNDKPHLIARYSVEPLERWQQMTKYKKFTIAEKTHKIGDCVFVKSPDESGPDWKAQVHEVRAADEHHVYLRCTWLENPKELLNNIERPSWYPHHGRFELIPSNRVDIIDAMSVNGELKLVHWDEKNDDAEMPKYGEYFWRRTFNSDTKSLSALRPICKCKKPHNPDKLIIKCGNKSCGKWLHASCLALKALRGKQEAKAESNAKTKKSTAKSKDGADFGTDLAEQDDENGTIVEDEKFKAEIVVPEAGRPEVLITNKTDGEVTKEAVHCLVCKDELVE